MTLTRPLPGIRFEPQARPLQDVLPRMDIPVFVGFAAAGPLHVPVAIEDVAGLAMIFGGDVELPRPRGANADARQPRYAHLAATVREFFRNGGRRCWVIRVADATTATSNSFLIPGLFDATTHQPAIAFARSQGSWSDALRVKTNLVPAPLDLKSFQFSPPSIEVQIASARDVAIGDLLRVTWTQAGIALYLFATNVTIVAPRVARVEGVQWHNVPSPFVQPLGDPALERLTFDLTVRRETEPPLRITGLGFAPEHPRYFGALPDDATLFTPDVETDWPDLWRDARAPRFPLAASDSNALYVPLTMSALLSPEIERQPIAGKELERNGLAKFGPELFLDANLRSTELRDLLDQADALRYQANLRLQGMHAALGIEEATMLAVPDAVHPGWTKDESDSISSPPASSPLAHPELWRWLDCGKALPDPLPTVNSGFVACSALDPVDAP